MEGAVERSRRATAVGGPQRAQAVRRRFYAIVRRGPAVQEGVRQVLRQLEVFRPLVLGAGRRRGGRRAGGQGERWPQEGFRTRELEEVRR